MTSVRFASSFRFNFLKIFEIIKHRMDIENIPLSPTITTKLRNRHSANKIKHGSPKLQEVLREKCRQKMREKRGQLFNRSRFGLEINCQDMQDTLTEIVRKELKNLATADLDPEVNPFSPIVDEPLDQEEALELEKELINAEAQWILQEYERMSQEEMELLALAADQQTEDVICPVCQTSNLSEIANQVVCKSCNFMLNNGIGMKNLAHLLRKCVDEHSAMCKESPAFMPLLENNNICLYLICDKCSALTPVI